MKTDSPRPLYDAPEPVMREAGAWLAKQDRGLTPEEVRAFEHWRRAHPSHQAAVAQLEQTLAAFDRIAELAPDFSPRPDPDAFAPARPTRLNWLWPAAAGLAAAAVLAVIFFHPTGTPAAVHQHYATAPGGYQRVTLPDGSVVDLNAGTVLDVDLAPAVRRVELSQGEAHFQVAHNPERPFIVTAQGISVRAVGTAFDVRLGPQDVAVLVTEGRVKVARRPDAGEGTRESGAGIAPSTVHGPPSTGDSASLSLGAGESIVVPLAVAAPTPQVAVATPADIAQRLAWQPHVLELRQTPLSEIVAELNEHIGPDQPRIVIADPSLASLRIGGNFRADQADAFVRLLETSFDVTAERSGDTITLRRAR